MFNRVPGKVPEKVPGEALVQEVRFGEGLGGFGAEAGQVQQRSGEGGLGEGSGRLCAEAGQVQQGSGEGSGEGLGGFGAG